MDEKNKRVLKTYVLEIWLTDIEPRIWRRFAVRPNITLDKLHMIIQKVMGWTNSHLHAFDAGDGVQYTYPYPDYDRYQDYKDECMFKLSDLVSSVGDRFTYEYDFGDGWTHIVELKKIEDAEKGAKYPVCLAGERACPPEDCGGPWSYPEMLEILKGPDCQEKQEYIDWLGGEFDPEAFDVKKVKTRFRQKWPGPEDGYM